MTPADRVNAAVAELAAALREQLRVEMAEARNDPPSLIDVPEAARLLGVSRTTAYTLLDAPEGLPTVRVGRRRLIRRVDVEAFAR